MIIHGSYFAEISTLQGWLLCLPCRNVCFRVIFDLQEKLLKGVVFLVTTVSGLRKGSFLKQYRS